MHMNFVYFETIQPKMDWSDVVVFLTTYFVLK